MLPRFHTARLRLGLNTISADQLHHAFDVLRLEDQTIVELFDDLGQTAGGRLTREGVVVETIRQAVRQACRLSIAAAVPKGDRADWMIEKLSELGVETFFPLRADRSVVVPEGSGKRARWGRIAVESAKQSRRAGVMTIAPLAEPPIEFDGVAWVLSTQPDARPIAELLADFSTARPPDHLIVYVGPEGGWTERELAAFAGAGLTAVALTDTILRVETAAIAAAAVLLLTANARASASVDSPPALERPAS